MRSLTPPHFDFDRDRNGAFGRRQLGTLVTAPQWWACRLLHAPLAACSTLADKLRPARMPPLPRLEHHPVSAAPWMQIAVKEACLASQCAHACTAEACDVLMGLKRRPQPPSQHQSAFNLTAWLQCMPPHRTAEEGYHHRVQE